MPKLLYKFFRSEIKGLNAIKHLLFIAIISVLSNGILFCQNPVDYVNCLCGTAGFNNSFPGPVLPFGMIQWSPETEAAQHKGGYLYTDSRISQFSLDHISGAGCFYGENIAFMPIAGTIPATPPASRTAFSTYFSHSNEIAIPGYYSVTLNNNLKVELTAKTRSSIGRFTYPSGTPATMMINAGSAINGTSITLVHIDSVNQAVSGFATGRVFCGSSLCSTIYFYAVFDHPFSAYSVWSGSTLKQGGTDGYGTTTGAYITFDTTKNRVVLVKVAISYVSTLNAKLNLLSELTDSVLTSTGFDGVAAASRKTWDSYLSRIEISGGAENDMTIFYSMMYHALLAPTTCSDVNGQYMGYDGKVHTTSDGRVQYANFSGWDVYRGECQFISMITPDEAGDMAQSLLMDYQQGGAFPRWGVPNYDSGIMMGDPAAPMITEFYTFGAKNFDTTAALAGLLTAATNPLVRAPRSNTNERDALSDYLTLGYVPEGQKGGYGNVSMTLEYSSEDFALSRFAESLGDTANSAILLKHAQNWRNLYNPVTGYIQMRRNNGSWAPGFSGTVQSYDNNQAYVEGNAAQYVWMVPFNIRTLADMMGGREVAEKRLDYFLSQLNTTQTSDFAWLGNEPSLGAPWIYCFLGKPFKTQNTVRLALNTLFSSNPNAYPGNDDLGEMSSWYLWGALGMYPALPGSDILILASPLFPKVVLHLKKGNITITGNGANTQYVHDLTVNGQQWNKPWIKFSDISNGGSITYNLSSTPDSSWGSNLSCAPPSYPLGIPEIPVKIYPSSGDTLGINDTLLVWHSVTGAISYHLQIANDTAFGSIAVEAARIKDTTFNLLTIAGSKVYQGQKYFWRIEADNENGQSAYSQSWSFVLTANILGIKQISSNVPRDYSLSQNYPNPFNPNTKIRYSISRSGVACLNIYNILGQKVMELVNMEQNAGIYEISFYAGRLSSGVYLYRLQSGNVCLEKKMILEK